jgi:capsular exopolysaccharide synthesis family protein
MLPRGGKGLSEALAGIAEDPFTQCVTKTAFNGLDLMPCGRIPPNPNELLASQQMVKLIEAARERYDYVIIDLPPVCATSDAGVLAPLLTGYILVARAGYSNLTALQDSIDILSAVHASILGFVINDVSMRGGGRYYGGRGRYSRYYYYSGARYSEEKNTEGDSKK